MTASNKTLRSACCYLMFRTRSNSYIFSESLLEFCLNTNWMCTNCVSEVKGIIFSTTMRGVVTWRQTKLFVQQNVLLATETLRNPRLPPSLNWIFPSWTGWSLKMERTGSTETSVSSHLKQRNSHHDSLFWLHTSFLPKVRHFPLGGEQGE